MVVAIQKRCIPVCIDISSIGVKIQFSSIEIECERFDGIRTFD